MAWQGEHAESVKVLDQLADKTQHKKSRRKGSRYKRIEDQLRIIRVWLVREHTQHAHTHTHLRDTVAG